MKLRLNWIRHDHAKAISLSMALIVLFFFAGCEDTASFEYEEPGKERSMLFEAQKRGNLRIVTLNAPTTYYEGRDGKAGFEYELASLYAEHLGLQPQFIVAPTIDAALDALAQDHADIAAAGLSITMERKRHFRYGPSYMSSKAMVVCRRGAVDRSSESAKLLLASGSSYLEAVSNESHGFAEVGISNSSVEALLARVASDKNLCTMADEHVVSLHRRYLPSLIAGQSIGEASSIAWMAGGGHSWRNVSLLRELAHWMQEPHTQAAISALKSKYFAIAENEFDYVDLARLRRAIRQTLPAYEAWFQEAARRYELPWSLLAGMGWQESRWQPGARSVTGVRGLMMLTQVTAREQGVRNRLDPKQSIVGGARYLAALERRLPKSIEASDRLKFALAAYNMGWGHMMDARSLASSRGLDHNKWAAVGTVLADLEDPDVYRHLAHGYARGREGAAYVQAVMNFTDIIEKAKAKAIQPDLPVQGSAENLPIHQAERGR